MRGRAAVAWALLSAFALAPGLARAQSLPVAKTPRPLALVLSGVPGHEPAGGDE